MSDESENPPPAPEIRRSIRFTPWQMIGLSILIAIPVLALFGVFGETRATASARTSNLEILVDYPTRYRYKMLNSVRVDISNTSAAVLDAVTVALDTAYASRFSTVVAIPDFAFPYSVELTTLEPGQTRRVTVELQGERYGRHRGNLSITSTADDDARLPVSTFIFP